MIRMAGSVSKRWLARQLGVVFDRAYYFDVEQRQATDIRCNQYVAQMLGDLDVFYTESNLGRRGWYGDEQVLVGGIQPNMIVGMLLGADFVPMPDADADISPGCLVGRDGEALPHPAELLHHPLIQLWDQQLEQIWEDPAAGRRPVPPFFWDGSGRAAVHGAVTSGLKFLGDDFLMRLLTEPERSRALVDWLTEVTIELVSHFAAAGRMPVRGIHVGECVACMLDVATFRTFVVPVTSRLGAHFGHLRFHSCGRSDHVLDACRDITGIASLDVGGETSVAKIRAVFGDDFPVGIAPLVDDMRAPTPDRILQWYRQLVADNGDGDLTIGFHLEADYRLENIRALWQAVNG